MKILLTNDDGIYAEGLKALYERFSAGHAVTIIAPDRERSAEGHGITLHEPLRVSRVSINSDDWGYAVNGTSVDCIKIGVLELLEHKPDLVISGINPGMNTSININYSGTVAAAMEATIYGVPAVSVSIQGLKPATYGYAALFTEQLAKRIVQKGLPQKTFLNVNIPDVPADKIAGVKISRQGTELPTEYMDKKTDTRGQDYYWYGYEFRESFEDAEIDEAVLLNNYVSITPLKCDMTDYDMIEELKKWDI